MLEHIETLVTLAEQGTMTRTATRLRMTQSAVSKRLAALERELGTKLLEPSGRNVRLTAQALELVSRARPLLSELSSALHGQRDVARGKLLLGVSESILASWGAFALARVRRALPEVELELHAHRSPVAVDGVRAGEFTLALVAGELPRGEALWVETVAHEDMVLLGLTQRLRAPLSGELSVLGIERHSATSRSLEAQLQALRKAGVNLTIRTELESFAAVVQLARAGFGPALVPRPLALALGAKPKELRVLPPPGLLRPVSLVGRKSAFGRAPVQAFRSELLKSLRARGPRACAPLPESAG
jgi:DNA-binding transcriptional LysR family regulator